MVEESLEGDANKLIVSGKRDWLRTSLREAEDRTGVRYLPEGLVDAELTDLHLKEAYSKIGVEMFLEGKADADGKATPGKNSEWKRAMHGSRLGRVWDATAALFDAAFNRASSAEAARKEAGDGGAGGGREFDLYGELARGLGLEKGGGVRSGQLNGRGQEMFLEDAEMGEVSFAMVRKVPPTRLPSDNVRTLRKGGEFDQNLERELGRALGLEHVPEVWAPLPVNTESSASKMSFSLTPIGSGALPFDKASNEGPIDNHARGSEESETLSHTGEEPGIYRDESGRLRDAKTRRFVVDRQKPPSPYKYSDADRRKDWKRLVDDLSSPLTDEQRTEIRQRGYRGPQQYNQFGEIETMELSHEPIPLRGGGKVVVPRWPLDHAAVDKHRKLKKRQAEEK